MSEEDRSRLYAWLREHADEPIAEYMMSCLPTAPLSDLVTKQHLESVLSAEFSNFALTMGVQREADRAEHAAQHQSDRVEHAAQRESDRAEYTAWRETDRSEHAAQRETDRSEHAAQRESDRAEYAAQRESDRETYLAQSSRQFRWLIGTFIALTGVLIAAIYGAVAIA